MKKNVSIFELKSVKWITLVSMIFVVGSSLSIFIDYILTVGVNFDYSGQGWAYLLELYDFPLKVVAAWIGIVGLISLNHRSEQTKQQLELATSQIVISSEQNKFTNYYKHLEEFDKYITTLQAKGKCVGMDIRQAHNAIYPDCLVWGDYRVPRGTIHSLADKSARCFSEILSYACSQTESCKDKAYQTVSNLISDIKLIVCDEENNKYSTSFESAKDDLHGAIILAREVMKELSILIEVLEFDNTVHSRPLNCVKDLLKEERSAMKTSHDAVVSHGRIILNVENDELPLEFFELKLRKLIDNLNMLAANPPTKHLEK
ncbi:hypothetical protein [Vibrio sp. CyArs1]|uniref:hypothetical protein n=1 Tax=Vibrio sp. CyArs1 TaxID=2682577 RepID=UPI001F05F3A7|nr:hypothetical protein [Vibrio sp. CyArs1]